ncbi:MAG: class F sortase [Minisyncoccia bacterium]
MPSILSTILQLALSLIVSVQNNTSLSVAQQQQAIMVATQAIQVVTQTISLTTTTVGTTGAMIAKNEDGSPVRLIIPKLNIDAGFQYTGLKSDGTMEVPSNIYDVGWFTGSARPGERGVAIITGHIAQIRKGVVTKLGVFNDLNELSAGDKLYVLNDKGESATFTVRESRSYDPSADAIDVFTSTDGGAHLNLITCEGSWNQAQLSYTQRLVVFTDAAQ